jgi:tetratricopeptide (TPR) repeat protein
LATSVFLLRSVDQARPAATLEEILYIPSPKALKRMSLGYDGLMADIYWTRAVQYFGGKLHSGSGRYDLLAPLLEITTTLDPHLLIAYEYGANFLASKPPMGAGMPEKAIQLIEEGTRKNPDQWRLYWNLGFIYYLDLKDYKRAADAFNRAADTPNAHPGMRILAASAAQRGGDIQTARMLWALTYKTTASKDIRANAAAHLRASQVDIDVTNLEALVAQYRAKTGYLPAGFWNLTAAGMLRGIPTDPLGRPYKLMPDGRIEVSIPDDFPFITKGTPPGYKPSAKPKLLPGNSD